MKVLVTVVDGGGTIVSDCIRRVDDSHYQCGEEERGKNDKAVEVRT